MKTLHLLSASFMFLAACKESQQSSMTVSGETSAADKSLIESVLKADPKGEAQAIKQVKTSVKVGEEVTIAGRVMGNVKPFVEGRAAFLLADPSLIAACSDKPGDECDTPWDACCHTSEEKKKAIATIRIVNTEGRVLKQSVEGIGGIVNLAHLTVSGKVAPGSEGDVLIIDASAIRATP